MNDTLEAGAGGAGFRGSLRARRAAQTAVEEFLDTREKQRPRTRVDRIFGLRVLSPDSGADLDDALREIVVGEALDRLGEQWTVLHAVPIDGRRTHIDHLVIGPAGVFALSTRNHSDESVWIAHDTFGTVVGRPNHIRNSEFEIGRVERTLSAAVGSAVHAAGIIVIVDPKSIMLTGKSRDVAVVTSHELVEWLESRPGSLDAAQVDEISRVAELPGTWSPDPEPVCGGDRLFERFDEIRGEIAVAERARRLWCTTVTSGLLASVAFAAWGVMLATATPL